MGKAALSVSADRRVRHQCASAFFRKLAPQHFVPDGQQRARTYALFSRPRETPRGPPTIADTSQQGENARKVPAISNA